MTDAMALFLTSVLPCSLGVIAILFAEALERRRDLENLLAYLTVSEILASDLQNLEQILEAKLKK
jgi:hypothetical protein